MSLPVLLDPAEVASYLGVSEDTLARWRTSGEGPLSVRIGQRVAYTEQSVSDYINAQMTGSKAATPAQIQSAMSSFKEVSAAHRARVKEMQDLDREKTDEANPYAVTVSAVGSTPNEKIERHFLMPTKPIEQAAPPPPHILQNR